VITYVNPAVAVLAGVAFLGEEFTLGMAVGFPLILLGSVLAARRRGAAATVDGDQSIRTVPLAVSKSAATMPVPSAAGGTQLTPIPSSGCSAEVPR